MPAIERRTDGYQEPELVLLVGTAHVSQLSAQHVQRVVEAVQPDAVVVELCRSRAAIMSAPAPALPQPAPLPLAAVCVPPGGADGMPPAMPAGAPPHFVPHGQLGSSHPSSPPSDRSSSSNSSSGGPDSSSSTTTGVLQPGWPLPPGRPAASGAGMLALTSAQPGGVLGALQRSAALGGQSGLLLRLLLSGLADRVAGALEVQPGAEFVAARVAAEAVGAQLVLGDRPIEITLQRAWSALPPLRRLALCAQLLSARWSGLPSGLDAALVERSKADDVVSSLMAALGAEYPELMGPVVHERDAYLAWSLKRSKAVNGTRCVVGVVGAGHLRGVVYALAADIGGDRLRFSELVDNMNQRAVKEQRRREGIQRLVLELMLGLLAYLAWGVYMEGPGALLQVM